MSGASTASRSRRAASPTWWPEVSSSTCTTTSAEGSCSRSAAPSRVIAGSCPSVAATLVAAAPLSSTRRLGCRWPLRLIDALREVADDVGGGGARRQPLRQERVQRLELGLALARVVGRTQREEPGAHLHRPAHRLGLA